MRIWLFSSLLILLCHYTAAQIVINGTVIEKVSRKPVEFASVHLIHLPDSTLLKVTATDKKGKFFLETDKQGTYVIQCSFIGYDKIETAPFKVDDKTPIYNIPSIQLVNNNKSLEDVTIVGRKATLNAGIDRKIYNVDQDIMSRSGSVSDILKNIPSVEVDIEGNVNLRGSGEILILINGKPSPLMGRTRAEVLQQLPANSIERIEVITNPSARYRPDGTSGIINIVLKKNVKDGFNATTTINAGNKNRYNGNITLNYRPKNLNLFGSYSYRQDTRIRKGWLDRDYLDTVTGITKSYFTQLTNSLGKSHSNVATAGIDYTINEKNSIGVSATYFYRKFIRNENTSNQNFTSQKVLINDFNRIRYNPEHEKQLNSTLYFQRQFGNEDHEIRAEFTRSVEDESEDNHYSNVMKLPAGITTFENISNNKFTHENQFVIDYTNPLSEVSKLEAGYDGSYDKLDQVLNSEFFDAVQNRFVTDRVKSNQFIFHDNMHALYVTYQKNFEKFGYELGIRGEGVFTTGRLVTLDSVVKNDYFKIYPTLHLSYKLSETGELQLNYSKRVNRPDADELNPFPEYQDPRNLRAGNPKLLPEIIHSVEVGYRWQGKNISMVPSIYYRYKLNGFTSVVVPLNDSTLLTTNQNLSNDRSAGLEFIFTAKAGNWFAATWSANVFNNRIDASNIGYDQSKSIYSMSSNLSTNFSITTNTILQVTGNYRSARLTPQGKSFATAVMNAGFRQDFLQKKLSVTLTASNLLNSLKQKSDLHTLYFNQFSTGTRDAQVFYLGVSYRFGVIKKQKEEKLQFDDSL